MSTDLTSRLEAITAAVRDAPATVRDAVPAGDDALVQAGVAAAMLGAALAALDEYDAFVRGRVGAVSREPVPAPPGDQETDYRRWLGMAIGRIETARCILEEAGLAAGNPTRVRMLAREATRLAYDTVQDLIVHISGGGLESDRLDEAVTAMVRLWRHPLGAVDDQFSRLIARERLQLA